MSFLRNSPENSSSQDRSPASCPSSYCSKILPCVALAIAILLFFIWKNAPSDYDSLIPDDKSPVLTLTSQDPPQPISFFTQNTPTSQFLTLPNPPSTLSLEEFLTQSSSPNTLANLSLSALLNGFDLTPQEQFINANPLRINSEFLICPWNPSSYLLLIQIQNQSNAPHSTLATLDFPTHAIQSVQLLGQPHCSNPTSPNSLTIPAKQSLHYLFQITTKANDKPLTHLLLNNDSSTKQRWLLSPQKQHEPSHNARFASLLAEFYLWKQQSPLIKLEMIHALAQECLDLQQNPAQAQAIHTILKQLPN